jgi:hypothetical protein
MCCLFLLVCASPARAQYDTFGRWDYHEGAEAANFVFELGYTAELAHELVERWGAIGEVSGRGDWTGDFFRPFGMLGTTILRIGPKGDYVRLSTHSCRPDVRRFDFGHVVETGEGLRLMPESPGAEATDFVKVTWGDRRYLVEEDAMRDFCRFASGRRVVRNDEDLWSEGYFRNEGGGSGPVSGAPSVPPRFAALVVPSVETRLIRIMPRRSGPTSARYTLRFDGGTEDGLLKRMRLAWPDGDGWGVVEVVRAGPHWCEATLVLYDREGEDASSRPARVPAVGTTFTTCVACE